MVEEFPGVGAGGPEHDGFGTGPIGSGSDEFSTVTLALELGKNLGMAQVEYPRFRLDEIDVADEGRVFGDGGNRFGSPRKGSPNGLPPFY